MPAARTYSRRKEDKPVPWWTDRHILGAFFQPLLAVAIVQAPDWLQPWIAAVWSGLAAIGIVSARQATGRVTIRNTRSDG